MTEPETLSIEVNGFATRVWRKGSGKRLGFFAGFGGLPRWIPMLDRLAEHRTVIVPSLPGFPGGDRGHSVLDTQLDWVLAMRELVVKSDLAGADLAGSSVGASLALEVPACWPDAVRRLALIAPFGLILKKTRRRIRGRSGRTTCRALMCADPENWKRLKAMPEGANSIEWPIEQTRANEAAARIFWPLGNTGLAKRLHLVQAPTLLLWGDADKVMPPGYADRFARGIAGDTQTKTIAGAGHLAELDQPDAVAEAILAWTA